MVVVKSALLRRRESFMIGRYNVKFARNSIINSKCGSIYEKSSLEFFKLESEATQSFTVSLYLTYRFLLLIESLENAC
jgi:hypothetical protein